MRIATLSLDDGRIRSWIDVPGREASLARRAGRVQNAAYVFGKEPKYAVSGGRAVTISRHPDGPDAIIRAARETPMAPTLPVLESLYLDSVGNLWVEPYSAFAAPMPPFEVYAPDGSLLGSVAVPPGLGDARQVWFGFPVPGKKAVLADLHDLQDFGRLDEPQRPPFGVENGPERARSLLPRKLVFLDPEVIGRIGDGGGERREVLGDRSGLVYAA